MIKRGWSVYVVLSLCFVLLIGMASAEIFISQPDTLYNFGDRFSVDVSVSSITDSSGFLEVSLVCGMKVVPMFMSPYSLKADEDRSVTIEGKLDKFLVGNVTGEDCYLSALYMGESFQSQKFSLSNRVDVYLDIENFVLDPGQTFSVGGSAVKENGESLEGFVEVFGESLGLSLSAEVGNGTFNFDVEAPGDAASGAHTMSVRVYEKDGNGEIINEGVSEGSVSVNQIVKKVELQMEKQEIIPGEPLKYSVRAYDQAEQEAGKEVTVTIYGPDGVEVEKHVVNTGADLELPTEYSSVSGYWDIEATLSDFNPKESFFVKELPRIQSEFVNETLQVENFGNALYEGAIEFKIGEEQEIKEVVLNPGEKKSYKLSAPDGDYNVGVKAAGQEVTDLGSAALTGRVISVDEISDRSFIWIISVLVFVLILAMVILYLVKKKLKGDGSKMIKPKGAGVSKLLHVMKKDAPDHTVHLEHEKKIASAATTTNIDQGHKEEATVIALKLKNYSALQKNKGKYGPLSAVESALMDVKKKGVKVYVSGDYRVMVLSKSMTHKEDNAYLGVTMAHDIKQVLDNHNHGKDLKIDYGIGSNIGEMIIEKVGGRFKFVSLGNVMAMAKNIADSSRGGILLSSALHRKLASTVKCDKTSNGHWKVRRIINREKHTDFVKGFVKRQKEEGQHKK